MSVANLANGSDRSPNLFQSLRPNQFVGILPLWGRSRVETCNEGRAVTIPDLRNLILCRQDVALNLVGIVLVTTFFPSSSLSLPDPRGDETGEGMCRTALPEPPPPILAEELLLAEDLSLRCSVLGFSDESEISDL